MDKFDLFTALYDKCKQLSEKASFEQEVLDKFLSSSDVYNFFLDISPQSSLSDVHQVIISFDKIFCNYI